MNCPNGCGVAQAPEHVMREHAKSACVRRPEPCEKCLLLVQLNLRAAHEKDDCRMRMVRCANLCALMVRVMCGCIAFCFSGSLSQVRSEQLEEHERSQCAYRFLQCPNECGAS